MDVRAASVSDACCMVHPPMVGAEEKNDAQTPPSATEHHALLEPYNQQTDESGASADQVHGREQGSCSGSGVSTTTATPLTHAAVTYSRNLGKSAEAHR